MKTIVSLTDLKREEISLVLESAVQMRSVVNVQKGTATCRENRCDVVETAG